MEIFGIGMGEMMLLLVLALIVVGPQKLPEIGRTLGTAINTFKAQTDTLRSVMSFDPTAILTAPAVTPVSPADERVTALQEYVRTRAAASPTVNDETLSPDHDPAAVRPDQEQAS